MDTKDFMTQLKEALKDDDFKDMMRSLVVEDDHQDGVDLDVVPKKNKKPAPKIYEVDDRDIPDLERSAAKQVKPIDGYKRPVREKRRMIQKRCGCGRMESIMAGSALDNDNFTCNRCLTR